MHTLSTTSLPVAVIGAGPIGLAAAAHLAERGPPFVVLEAGATAGAALTDWGHTRLFSPWRYNVDAAAQRLLEAGGWTAPDGEALPTGHELRDLEPLAQRPEIAESIRWDARVTAVSRAGIDKTRTARREDTPFLVRVEDADGRSDDVLAAAVNDSSGTWSTPNPLGQAGLPAPGEEQACGAGRITAPLPDVRGPAALRDRRPHARPPHGASRDRGERGAGRGRVHQAPAAIAGSNRVSPSPGPAARRSPREPGRGRRGEVTEWGAGGTSGSGSGEGRWPGPVLDRRAL